MAWRFRLPFILGCVVGGIVISPFTPGPHLVDVHSFGAWADVGVVLLMFSIGVEFSFSDLVRVKNVALIGGPIGILCILGIAIFIARISGWTMTQAVVIGATISATSTMVLASLLRESGKLGTEYGRVMIGITLVDDLAVVCMTAILLAFSGPGDYIATAAWTLGQALALLIPLIFLAIKVIPRLFRRVKETKSTELFLLVAIAVLSGLRPSRKPWESRLHLARSLLAFPLVARKICTRHTVNLFRFAMSLRLSFLFHWEPLLIRERL